MPTPLEVLLDPLSLLLLGLYAGLFMLEKIFTARPPQQIRGWYARALLSFVVYFYLASYLPVVWDQYLMPFQLFDLSKIGTLSSTLIVLGVFQVLLYVWHRSMHRSKWLWRAFHQMHHSAEQVDTLGAFYFSPLDMVGFTMLGSISLVLVVGVSPETATNFLLISQFLAVFQHCNIRTPHWLGYIIQRPESHRIHHGSGIHRYNYCDFPFIDMLFGTFRNPKHDEVETGFYPGASKRVVEMLFWKDVSGKPE